MTQLIAYNYNLFGDGIAFLERWDFSHGNRDHESRVGVVTKVASICYNNTKVIGSATLYDKLQRESLGLPSSSFEFVPVLLPIASVREGIENIMSSNICRYGRLIGEKYLLTNLRAMLHDGIDIFNDDEECDIIRQHTHFYRARIDLNTRAQLVRHRSGVYQELSRRYVSNERHPFEFYIPGGRLYDIYARLGVKLYERALAKGIKKEHARRVIPQGAYTTIWFGWLDMSGFENFLDLRTKSTAQTEIRRLAEQIQRWEHGRF